ncbi:MAG: ABC transporter permease [Cyclobacteriaceae bacterium]
MLLNYLKIAFRTLINKKVYSIINILGLSVGAAASLIIFLYVQSELSYDKFFPDYQNVYRVVEDRIYPDRVAHFAMIPSGFSNVIQEEVSEVESSTRLIGFPNFASVVRYKDNIFSEHYFFSADSNFFEVFPFQLLKGNKNDVLRHPNTIVLTASTATKYFGSEDPLGKVLELDNQNLEVVGVMEDVPENSHMKFDALGPAIGVDFLEEPNYYIAGTFTYLKLATGTKAEAAEAKIPALVDKYAAGQIERDLGISYQKYIADGNGYKYLLQPLTDIHLHSNRTNEIKANGNNTLVKVLMFIGLLILIIAGINFINLATARSAERAKEVGVRKVLGSKKSQLIAQFLSESFLISALSVVIAIVIIQLSVSYFNTIAQKELYLNLTENPIVIAVLLAITFVLGLIAGLYPAFYISALRPVTVLKGKFKSSSKGNMMRNGLVLFQFTMSIILISATLVVYDQLNYIQSKPLGFEKENLVVINHNSQDEESAALQQELNRIPGVRSIGSGNAVPGGYFFGLQFRLPGTSEIFTPKGMTADDNFATTLNLNIIEGRSFNASFNDSLSIIINQRAARAMNLDNPVGTVLINNADPNTPVSYTVVGVVEDFNFESLHSEINPLIVMSTEGQLNFQSVLIARLNDGEFTETISSLETKWKELMPNDPFIYSFMDSQLDNLYKSEQASGKLMTTFALIAIVIACVGLFGLAAYTANQRTKEIGVRKVLGATVTSIVSLVSKDFAKLVLISLLLGTPLAWFLMREWLQSFAYRITLSIETFLLAGLIVSLFTMATISYQALKAATSNPVNSLKDE